MHAAATEQVCSLCELLISVPPDEVARIKDLPASIEFSFTQKESRQYFDLAVGLYQKHVGRSSLSSLLKQVDKGAQLGNDDVAELKTIRKYALLMRNSFFLFDVDHEAPKAFDRFLVNLGHINDEIAIGDMTSAREGAHDLLGDFDSIRNYDFSAQFKPAKRGSVADHLGEQVGLVEKLLAKKKIRADQFHKIRKIVKELMDVYLFKASLESDSATLASDKKVYNFLYQLNQDMGNVHDDLVAKAHDGKIDYDSYELSVPARIRTQIAAVLDRIDS